MSSVGCFLALVEPEIAAEVVGQVRQGDLGRRPDQADGADDQSEGALLVGEDALYA